ncbi:hypothetical protein DJ82_12020 [Halorubrum sp. Ib24]|nr:hypothetical protein DJ82_12020 [Halorubrum sp. Ib24]OYR38683.1 hypothetical protein DJ75_17610 [Halorubrum sp. Eb13]OYR45079.1 hypothetical protein DJ81_05785 [Halorubrum sp. Hd13]OYR50822.1 hypothetical protein DJ74_05165 [Halorubrum sp. Ea8]
MTGAPRYLSTVYIRGHRDEAPIQTSAVDEAPDRPPSVSPTKRARPAVPTGSGRRLPVSAKC